jgi:hypothetical protein
MKIRVECYTGYGGEETPRRFWLGNTKVEVAEVLERWLGPDKRYFKILGDNHSIYTFCLHLKTGIWELSFYLKQEASTQSNGISEGD